ncbi:Phospholipid-translocating ATPase [Bertholletia excelsa]
MLVHPVKSAMKRYVYINDDNSSQEIYCNNHISNTKYTLLNFLPKNLWEQFSQFMNQFFLLIACLQLWSLITPVNPLTTWGPLVVIFAVSSTKEAWDDYNRYLSDKKANKKAVSIIKQGIKKQAIIIFMITICAYAFEQSNMEEMSMVALSGCIWLQAFIVAIETNSFTVFQHLAIWGNLAGFYVINWILSAHPSSGMHTIMFRLCRQPSYWCTMFLIVAAGMGPVLAIRYFRFNYRPSKINILQQAEHLGEPISSLGNIEPQLRLLEKDVIPLSSSPTKDRNSVYQPLLPNLDSQLSSSNSRNCRDS